MVVDTPEVVETPDVTGLSKNEDYEILKDPWTDEQETSLFKGIIRWKPAGNFELHCLMVPTSADRLLLRHA
jgi:MRG-binding protein